MREIDETDVFRPRQLAGQPLFVGATIGAARSFAEVATKPSAQFGRRQHRFAFHGNELLLEELGERLTNELNPAW